LWEGMTEAEALRVAAALESGSRHPLAAAIVQAAAQAGAEAPAGAGLSEFRSVTGYGVTGQVDGHAYRIGKPDWFDLAASDGEVEALVRALQAQGKTVMLLGDERMVLAAFAVADEIRANAKQAVQDLRLAGVERMIMLTGDHP